MRLSFCRFLGREQLCAHPQEGHADTRRSVVTGSTTT